MSKGDKHFPHPITLAVDVGGTGIKVMLLDARGNPLSERLRTPTPQPATPAKMLAALEKLRSHLPAFDRVSIGFPGVVKRGKIWSAANVDKEWIGFPLEATLHKRWKRPVHLANDAAVQGYGAISGKGVELTITLGTGMGSALFTDGHLCPGLELGHHPWRKGKTYEDYLGRKGLKKLGKKRWNKLLEEAIEQTAHTFNWDHLYIGGGNAAEINFTLPPQVTIISNEDGLFGGVALWRFQN
ncbi:polyphosphate glucokinase [Silvibacterium bohemicum]|uniref:Polyphosphate glucokinase n=1 Tax=Silvibacterium bohemicum TaxID=1577686 RepID=A0A841JWH2_9BACT|nr:ROK family protein [Silvibacterium bohemicum]MBB6142344.1 polyphosphate glucokinase [Silvibacterium bohemicum]